MSYDFDLNACQDEKQMKVPVDFFLFFGFAKYQCAEITSRQLQS